MTEQRQLEQEPNFHKAATDVLFSASHEDWHETREKLEEVLACMYLAGATAEQRRQARNGVTENPPASEAGDASSILASGTISAPQADGAVPGCDCLDPERCGVCHVCQHPKVPYCYCER